jgi:hypothetical protein
MSEQVGTECDERLRFEEGDGSFPSLGTRPGLKRGHAVLTLVAIAFGVIMVGLDATLGSLKKRSDSLPPFAKHWATWPLVRGEEVRTLRLRDNGNRRWPASCRVGRATQRDL